MIGRKAGALVLCLSTAPFLVAQPGHAQGILEDCEAQITEFCSGVTPGNGRIASCLYAHEDQLDEGCANAISDMGDILDFVFARIRDAMATCAADIEAQCNGIKVGGGRILTCLQEHAADVSPECQAEVKTFAAELAPE